MPTQHLHNRIILHCGELQKNSAQNKPVVFATINLYKISLRLPVHTIFGIEPDVTPVIAMIKADWYLYRINSISKGSLLRIKVVKVTSKLL